MCIMLGLINNTARNIIDTSHNVTSLAHCVQKLMLYKLQLLKLKLSYHLNLKKHCLQFVLVINLCDTGHRGRRSAVCDAAPSGRAALKENAVYSDRRRVVRMRSVLEVCRTLTRLVLDVPVVCHVVTCRPNVNHMPVQTTNTVHNKHTVQHTITAAAVAAISSTSSSLVLGQDASFLSLFDQPQLSPQAVLPRNQLLQHRRTRILRQHIYEL